jgi:hypothetical protein
LGTIRNFRFFRFAKGTSYPLLNGDCTHIGNESFSWFESTARKSRINFLQLMRIGYSDYCINIDAIEYMHAHKLPKYVLNPIVTQSVKRGERIAKAE